MAEVVQVDTFGGDIRADQQAQWGLLFTKGLDGFHQHSVTLITAQRSQLLALEFQVGLQLIGKKLQGLDAFGEDHQTVIALIGLPLQIGADRLQ